MANWYLNPALTRFRNEVNARWPDRDKRSDGTIGDAAHQATNSDHNPDTDGSVDAWDMDAGPGVDVQACIAAALKHESIQYVIYDRRITSRTWGLGTWRPYTGSNPHDQHVHFNTRSSHERSARPWFTVEDDVTDDDVVRIKNAILTHDLTPSGTAAGQPPTTVARVLLDITRMARQIWSTDDIVQAPEYGRTEENPYWTAGNTLSTATHHAHEASVKADAVLAGLAQLAEALPGGQGEPEPLDYDRLADALLRRIAATAPQT